MLCPKCGHANELGEIECKSCGIVFTKYSEFLTREKEKRRKSAELEILKSKESDKHKENIEAIKRREKHCPNCDASLTNPLSLLRNDLLSDETNSKIDIFLRKKGGVYCRNCSTKIIDEIDQNLKQMEDFIKDNLDNIPAVSSHSPRDWEYKTIGLVTGQSTIGTGFISEFVSNITDFFGLQAGMYNTKIRDGENFCLAQLRFQTLELGGNAILALDIDYSEIGALKGMIMVCATGTAVKITNDHEIEKDLTICDKIRTKKASIARYREWREFMTKIKSFQIK